MPDERVVILPGDKLRINRGMLRELLAAIQNGEDCVVIAEVSKVGEREHQFTLCRTLIGG